MNTTDRDNRVRFQHGNTIAVLGWRALVAKRFDGDERAARAWWGEIGAHTYAKQVDLPMLKACFAHPGTPEEFVAARRRMWAQVNSITLSNVHELEF